MEGKEAVKKTTQSPNGTEKGSTEYGRRLNMYTALSLIHDFDNIDALKIFNCNPPMV